MALPVVPTLKLLALSSVKVVVLGLGALIIPIQTVRLVVGGTGESVRIAANWMRDHEKLSGEETEQFMELLTRVQQAEYSREQARGLLFVIIKKSLAGMANSVSAAASWCARLFRRASS